MKVDTPIFFTAENQISVRANAADSNIYEYCHYYFDFGLRIAKLLSNSPLVDTLLEIFGVRYSNVMDLAQNGMEGDATELVCNKSSVCAASLPLLLSCSRSF